MSKTHLTASLETIKHNKYILFYAICFVTLGFVGLTLLFNSNPSNAYSSLGISILLLLTGDSYYSMKKIIDGKKIVSKEMQKDIQDFGIPVVWGMLAILLLASICNLFYI